MLGVNEIIEKNQESTKLGKRISSTQGCLNSENGQ
jgi:hypothetical protein